MTNYKIPTVKELKEQTEHGNHKFEFISFFAGGGGSSTGYRMAGGKALLINEFIPEACKTYAANWPKTKILSDDIRNLTPDDVLTAIGKKKGELFLLDGSPPCSAFSTAGSRDKGWGKTKKYSDSAQKNVEDLFFDFIRMVDGIQPKVFVAENVAGLAKGSAKGYLNQIIRMMRDCGYTVSAKVLNTKWLGVPQSRNRIIFVGIRNDIYKPEFKGKTHPKPHDKIINLKDAFDGLNFSIKDEEETDISKYATYRELVKLKKGCASKKYFSLKKGNPLSVSHCVTATTGSIGAAAARHWDNRAFTVDEIKRIMSVPDDYILTGKYQQKVERLGRMVAPFMMKGVAESILELGIEQ